MFLTLSGWEAGGLAMQEFNTYESCTAAKQVLLNSQKSYPGSSVRIKILTCVKK